MRPCPACGGAGFDRAGRDCPACAGTGARPWVERIDVDWSQVRAVERARMKSGGGWLYGRGPAVVIGAIVVLLVVVAVAVATVNRDDQDGQATSPLVQTGGTSTTLPSTLATTGDGLPAPVPHSVLSVGPQPGPSSIGTITVPPAAPLRIAPSRPSPSTTSGRAGATSASTTTTAPTTTTQAPTTTVGQPPPDGPRQLGPTPPPKTFEGTGRSSTPAFGVEGGLTLFRLHHAADGNFVVWLATAAGERLQRLVSDTGHWTNSRQLGVAAGSYKIDVDTSGEWSVTVEQPRYNSAPNLPARFSSPGATATGPFQVLANTTVRFDLAHGLHEGGQGGFVVWLLDREGNAVTLLTDPNQTGAWQGTKVLNLDAGIYVFDIRAAGDWSVNAAAA